MDRAPKVLHDMSRLLNTGLTRDQLAICVELVEQNIHPEAVAVSGLSIETAPLCVHVFQSYL